MTAAGGNAMSRVRSVDLLRGIVCVLMAIDHVRVYSGVPAGGPDPGVFFTRWVTHFVAPLFCFFAGTAAFYHGRALGNLGALRRFLVSRGLLLVALELTLIRLLWGFSFGGGFRLAGVIWMLGWCMVLLGLVVRMPAKRVGWIGVGIVALQQLFGLLPRATARLLPEGPQGILTNVWNFIYPAGAEPWGAINILYVIVPWIGLMMAGYGFGLLWDRPAAERDRLFTRLGLGMTAAFLVVGGVVALASGGDEGGAPFYMRLLGQQKYPASQLFLLMTIGPAIALLPWAERARGRVADAMVTFGRVPMFYYLAHLLVIHLLAIVTMRLTFGDFDAGWYATAPYTGIPEDHRWGLPLLYLNWAIALGILYGMCAWYAKRKATRPARWMRYL
jgi:uncharacterized membrane protein